MFTWIWVFLLCSWNNKNIIFKIRRSKVTDYAALNTERILDTTFWLKSWLKSILFGSNFFFLAKVLATTYSESG